LEKEGSERTHQTLLTWTICHNNKGMLLTVTSKHQYKWLFITSKVCNGWVLPLECAQKDQFISSFAIRTHTHKPTKKTIWKNHCKNIKTTVIYQIRTLIKISSFKRRSVHMRNTFGHNCSHQWRWNPNNQSSNMLSDSIHDTIICTFKENCDLK